MLHNCTLLGALLSSQPQLRCVPHATCRVPRAVYCGHRQTLEVDARRQLKVLVFCNTMDSCRAVEHHCRENNIPCVCYHGEMPGQERQRSIQAFAGAPACLACLACLTLCAPEWGTQPLGA